MRKLIPTVLFILVAWWGYTASSRLHERLQVACGDNVNCDTGGVEFTMLAVLTAFAAFSAAAIGVWINTKAGD
jgi:hypothetical protein